MVGSIGTRGRSVQGWLLAALLALTAPGAFAALGFTDPATLNTNADSDSRRDGDPQVTTDGLGRWVAVWSATSSMAAR